MQCSKRSQPWDQIRLPRSFNHLYLESLQRWRLHSLNWEASSSAWPASPWHSFSLFPVWISPAFPSTISYSHTAHHHKIAVATISISYKKDAITVSPKSYFSASWSSQASSPHREDTSAADHCWPQASWSMPCTDGSKTVCSNLEVIRKLLKRRGKPLPLLC